MTETSQSRIIGITQEMKGIEAQLVNIQTWDDSVGEFMKFQYMDMKRELLKELLIELIKSDTNLSDLDAALLKFVSYLSKQAKSGRLSPETTLSVHEVEQLVPAA